MSPIWRLPSTVSQPGDFGTAPLREATTWLAGYQAFRVESYGRLNELLVAMSATA